MEKKINMLAVLDLLEQGAAYKQIADLQGVCLKTFTKRLEMERRKRGVRTTYQLVAEHVKEKLKNG